MRRRTNTRVPLRSGGTRGRGARSTPPLRGGAASRDRRWRPREHQLPASRTDATEPRRIVCWGSEAHRYTPSPRMATLTTSVEPLEGNKVRLSVTVPSDEFEKAIDGAFR